MKKSTFFKVAIIATGVLILAYHFRAEQKQLATIATMGSFRVISVDSCTCVDTRNIPAGKPTLFMYFDPDCDHCQRETKELLANIGLLHNIRIYLVTNADNAHLRAFCKTFHTDKVPNLMVGQDYEYSFFRAYLPPTVPYLVVYNSRKDLVRLFRGETDVRYIIKATEK
jgi:hypothetical protein